MMEILKQDQYAPLAVEEQVVVLYFATHEYAKDVDVKDVVQVGADLLRFFHDFHPNCCKRSGRKEDLRRVGSRTERSDGSV